MFDGTTGVTRLEKEYKEIKKQQEESRNTDQVNDVK